ncbi:PREDICTED: uncharacterized protein LOC18595136 isoform X3 [Theobroma cacao]|uniref:Uncharacterized protein LOC18595136 isoform X3 n=1 Tax=Theobroma cacao TaxID=3641 RepID=A0AB32WKV3_THECC|nr:PREDICTED: uncharacterized protein LOC18595136 isoform X3 [Theobroma cacao]
MDIKPFLHEHHLLFDYYEACCDKCNKQIHDWAYSCERCKFWLHESCAKQQLPPQISAHPLHSEHNLTLFSLTDYVCAKCSNLSRGHVYCCKNCDFKLEYLCAFSPNAENNKLIIDGHISKKIHHFIFNQSLILFNYRRVGKYDYCCSWCEKHLSGMSYGKLEFFNQVFFHDSCLINMPSIIVKHPFHPSHPLQIQMVFSKYRCNACNYSLKGIQAYCCKKCGFYLHVLCARLQPSLKVELHEHYLSYFQIKSRWRGFRCKICNSNCSDGNKESVCYRCVQCDFNYHFNCLGVLSSTRHKYHRHELMLIDSFIEDDSKEYYCDICEEERKPKHHVYCCKKCKFVAHIECALNKVVDTKLDHGSASGLLVSKEETEQRNAEFPTHLSMQIKYIDHPHVLSYNEATEQNKSLLCKACCQEIFDQHYACEDCEYYLHETCTTLPYEVSHPLHRQHPLKLFTDIGAFPCSQCRDYSDGFSYICYPCDFKLDVKCAAIPIAPNKEGRGQIEMERLSKLCPFNHNHKLEFFNCRANVIKDLKCYACLLPIVGSAYRCRECFYTYAHESCLALVREMQHPFHPLHFLHPQIFLRMWSPFCFACGNSIDMGYSCQKLRTEMHPRACNKCESSLDSQPFYHCLECGIRLHIKCVPIPHLIKSKCHIHHLILKDHFVEDDSREYYCDICEEERNSNNHVYYCEECYGQFVAHIECVLPTVDKAEPAPEASLIQN